MTDSPRAHTPSSLSNDRHRQLYDKLAAEFDPAELDKLDKLLSIAADIAFPLTEHVHTGARSTSGIIAMQALLWLRADASIESAEGTAAAYRADYRKDLLAIRALAADDLDYQLTGSKPSKQQATAALLASLNLSL